MQRTDCRGCGGDNLKMFLDLGKMPLAGGFLSNAAAVKKENLLYKCGWSPFEGVNFKSRVTHTFVNGTLVYQNSKFFDVKPAKRLTFNR